MRQCWRWAERVKGYSGGVRGEEMVGSGGERESVDDEAPGDVGSAEDVEEREEDEEPEKEGGERRDEETTG